MAAKVDLYNNAYGNYGAEVYRQVRVETYGEDFGQTSWATTEESNEIPRMLGLSVASRVLEIGCGSGQYALQVASATGCNVVAIDINGPGIRTANQLAAARNMCSRARFEQCDASKELPFSDASFDAAYSNDVLCHIPGRSAVFREVFRAIRAGSKFLFSDALVIGGTISHEEIANRSSIGYYVFSPPGENERLLEQQGFRILSVADTSQNAAMIAKRWHDARQARAESLLAIEGKQNFEGLQLFLSTVHKLCGEGRLQRYVYLAEKPAM